MTTSEAGIAFIKRNEGYSAGVYQDNGREAIGYGHDLLPGEQFPEPISFIEADRLLRRDLQTRYEPKLQKWLDMAGVTLTQGQWDALIDFAYNLGTGSLVTLLGHGLEEVPNQIPRWNHVNGAENAGPTERRKAEVEMWNGAPA